MRPPDSPDDSTSAESLRFFRWRLKRRIKDITPISSRRDSPSPNPILSARPEEFAGGSGVGIEDVWLSVLGALVLEMRPALA